MNNLEKSQIEEGLKDQKGFQKLATELGVSKYYIRSLVRSIVTENIRKQYNSEYDGGVRLKRVKKSKTKRKRAIILSDIHIPFQDQSALAVAVEYTKEAKPDAIILNGDIIDCYAISKYMKDPLRIETLQDELDECNDFIGLLRRQHPKAQIIYTSGNHEQRLEKILIDKAPGLFGLRSLSIDKLLGLQEHNVLFVDESVFLGDLEVTHGASARSSPGGSATAHYVKSGRSTLIGHVHRLNTTRRTTGDKVHVLMENGHLADSNPAYLSLPADWQQGFSEVLFSKQTGEFEVKQHHIKDGVLVVDGVVYSANDE